jgi:exodeoxyribonuclease V beta subunit
MQALQTNAQIFKASEVALDGINLIEASAGTGKTYSIALLVLRLIVQKNTPIEKILLVTFTRDAAAEMKLRVRLFIRKALNVAKGLEDDEVDEAIREVVGTVTNEEAINRLNNALLTFDKAAIYTIHSFCSKILKEYAFETERIFNAATMHPSEFNELFEEVFNQGWRDEITTLPAEILGSLLANKLSRETVSKLVKDALAGKRIFLGDRQNENLEIAKNQLIQELLQYQISSEPQLEVLTENKQEKHDALSNYVNSKKPEWLTKADLHKSNTVRNKIPIKLEESPLDLITILRNKSPQYAYEFFKDDATLESLINDYNLASDLLKNLQNTIKTNSESLERAALLLISVLASIIYRQVLQRINNKKQVEGYTTYDDMIDDLHRTVCYRGDDISRQNRSQLLIQTLQNRYEAVFIDEFQDTDRQQYEIFSTLFHSSGGAVDHVVFYIGDPKQSIYAFRKADLNTYFRARAQSKNHVMNVNYRSSEKYISAMNFFFNAEGDFDTFRSDQMRYYHVEAPETPKEGGLLYRSSFLSPLRILSCHKRDNIFREARNLVKHLLFNPDFSFSSAGKKIKPSQIGILVRTSIEGRKLRNMLAKSGIIAVTLSDEKIFHSPHSSELLYILEAAENITKGNIKRAMITEVAGFSWQELDVLNMESLFQRFRSYMETWKSKGVYVFLRQFLQDTAIIKRGLEGSLPNADRQLSDIFQLMEILHEAETDKHYTPQELIDWFKKAIEGEAKSEDEYIQRIESDDEAVKIITIHRAKGLEYDIVIAPFLDMKYRTSHKTKQFSENEQYYIADTKLLDSASNQITKLQEDQENLRLLYVALTRAKYHCYVLRNKGEKGETALTYILDNFLLQNTLSPDIRLLAPEDLDDDKFKMNIHYEPDAPEFIDPPRKPVQRTTEEATKTISLTPIPRIEIPDQYWQKTSYSGLNPKHDTLIRLKKEVGDDEYDQFVFRQIRSGAQAGNFLHELLERIDFSEEAGWGYKISSMIKRYPGIIKTENAEDKIVQVIRHAIHTNLHDGEKIFTLSEVKLPFRIQEMEFDVPLADVDLRLFPESLENGKIPFRIKREDKIAGILNGKIDLFFEHEGRYYLLDWKSNHLGNQKEDYHDEALAGAMEEHNYYLQYYLYCLAMYRYLKLRLPGFDYEKHFGGVYYLFLRGMRTGSSYGIYNHRPALEDLMELDRLLLLQQPR